MRPSGLWGTPGMTTYSERSVARWSPEIEPMTEAEIGETIEAYARSAELAMEAGFDGVTLHGGHGYLLDAFVWADTNRRTDSWGGDLAARVRYPAAVVAAVREAIGPDSPLFYRFSQHTQQDYKARKAETPEELGVYLGALAEAGVDLFDASTRRFGDPAFPELEGDDGEVTLAGWARRLTGPWAGWASARRSVSRRRAPRCGLRTMWIRSWNSWNAGSSISSPWADFTWRTRRSPGSSGRRRRFRSSCARSTRLRCVRH